MTNRAAKSIEAIAPNVDIQGELLEAILIAVPGPSHITDIDLRTENEIRFTWRGDRFVVRERFVEQVKGNILESNNLAELMQAVIMRGYIAALDRKLEREKFPKEGK